MDISFDFAIVKSSELGWIYRRRCVFLEQSHRLIHLFPVLLDLVCVVLSCHNFLPPVGYITIVERKTNGETDSVCVISQDADENGEHE